MKAISNSSKTGDIMMELFGVSGSTLIKPIDTNNIKVYDKDLYGEYYVDIIFQALAFAKKSTKKEIKVDAKTNDYGITTLAGSNLWETALEYNVVSLKSDFFSILKNKNKEEIINIIFEKHEDILHTAIRDENNNISLKADGMTCIGKVNLEVLEYIENMEIYEIPYYYSKKLSDLYKKQSMLISINEIKKDINITNSI